MIFATSTPLIEGERGSGTKAGQKKMLMYRRAKPHYYSNEILMETVNKRKRD